MYNIHKTPEEQARDNKFTQGDYRRFCAIFYLQTRKLIKDAVFLVKREKKLRIMPRHILTAAVLNGILPQSKISERLLSPEQYADMQKLLK